MRNFRVLLIFTALVSTAAIGETLKPLPPPDKDEAGVVSAPIEPIQNNASESGENSTPEPVAVRDESSTLPEKVRGNEPPPTVTIRTEGNNTIEEYRQGGVLFMVKITPKRGIAYTFLDTDGDGQLEGDPKEGSLQPNWYTIYEWE